MKKPVIVCVLVVVMCLGLTSVARATFVEGWQEWGRILNIGESFTCIAYYGLGSVEFTLAPVWTSTYPFDYVSAGWQTALSGNNKIAFLYGPRITNETSAIVELFSYELHYQWDDEDPGFEEDYPVYQDIAVFDSVPFGEPSYNEWDQRGTPGNGETGSWEYRSYPYEGPYTNPAPEPMTICLFGLGAVFLRIRKRPLNLKCQKEL